MIRIEDLHISLGGNAIIAGLNLQIKAGEKLALTGRNGAGKTTLLRAIAGEVEPEKGHIYLPKDSRIGYLRQISRIEAGRTVMDEARRAFPELLRLEQSMQEAEKQLSGTAGDTAAAQALAEAEYRYRMLGGYTYRGTLERILKGLGFSDEDFDKPLDAFSGGWQMRVELAKILAGGRDILLLDEPTNYLDLESILWLEDFLKRYEGILVLVSHDKRFLDTVTRRTLELDGKRYWDLPYGYSEFLQRKAGILEKQRREALNQEREIKRTEQLIERFRYKATKAAFAQSLIKKLEKMERIEMPDTGRPVLRVQFPPVAPSGKSVFRAWGLSKRYGAKQVLRDLEFHVARGEKIAFVGRNGMGKTTLASILAGENDYEGVLETGHNVHIGYFAQDQSRRLPGAMRIIDYLEHQATAETRPRVRDVAGAFLFSDEAVFKPIEVLSGGERNRVALAGMMLRGFNVLIMDEPTNHLDIPSKETLKAALKDFPGTLIVVSHDRDFLAGLTGQTWEFRPLEVRRFQGDINEFLESRRLDDLQSLEARNEKPPGKNENTSAAKKQGARIKEMLKARRRLEKQLKDIEAQIEKAERELEAMEQRMQQGDTGDAEIYTRYETLRNRIDELYARWEQTDAEREHITAELEE